MLIDKPLCKDQFTPEDFSDLSWVKKRAKIFTL